MINKEKYEFLRLCQYMYKKGSPVIPDSSYDALLEDVQKTQPDTPIRWETVTDEEGKFLMQFFNIENIVQEAKFPIEQYLEIEEIGDELKEWCLDQKGYTNRSIPIVTEEDLIQKIVDLFQSNQVESLFASLKLDGWNITVHIKHGYIVYAHTRGKLGENKDVTSLMKLLLKKVDGKFLGEYCYIVGELVLNSKHLQYLRDKYRKPFKTARNSVTSFISNKVVKEDLELVDYFIFKIEGDGYNFNSLVDQCRYLELLDLKIPLNKVIDCNLESMLNVVYEWGENINSLPPCDGIVFQPLLNSYKQSMFQLASMSSDSYDMGIYAVKMHVWGRQILKTVIKDIIFTENSKSRTPSIIVDPVQTTDGRTIVQVPVDHIGRLVDEDLYVGKEVFISVVSEKDIRIKYNKSIANMRLLL